MTQRPDYKNGSDNYSDTLMYFKVPRGLQKGEDRVVRSAKFLLDHTVASKFCTKFLVGANRMVFWGQPIAMATRSQLLDGVEPLTQLAADPLWLARDRFMSEDEVKAFI